MLKEGIALGLGRSLEHLAYKLADHVVVISSAFANYIEGVGVDPAKISDIPNWADLQSIQPRRPDQEMRERFGASPGDFLVVHTGNMGAKQDLLNVVAAADNLKVDAHIKFALIGDGQERNSVAGDVTARHLSNIRVMPLQASNEFSAVLSAADALLVNQAPMIIDSVLPSKLLAYMASGRPVIASAHKESTTAHLVRRSGCGVVADPGRPEALAAAIREMASVGGPYSQRATMGRRGRAYVEQHFERSSMLKRWDDLLVDLARTL
jgi:glycosyltransferase involved in cell wall biosynthesis